MIIHLLIVGRCKFNNKTKDTYTDQVTVESFLELQEKKNSCTRWIFIETREPTLIFFDSKIYLHKSMVPHPVKASVE